MWLNWRLRCFLFCFLFQVLSLRPSTGDTLRLLPRRAASRLQTEISHADRNFSFALVVLHAFDMASVALQHNKAREGGRLSLSSATRQLAAFQLASLFFFCLVFLLCFRSLFGLRPSTGPVAWVPFGRVGWRLRRKKTNTS